MKAPAFQFYPSDFIMGVSGMSAEDRGVYITLLCFQWERGSLPKDEKALRNLVGTRRPISVVVMSKFELGEDGLLRNPRLEKEREKQRVFRESRAENAKKRWDEKACTSNARASKVHVLDQCSSSLSPSSSSVPPEEPTIAEAAPAADSKPPRKEATGDHAEFIRLWTAAYPEHHGGEAYVFQNAKDGTAVKQLLATSRKTPAELMLVAVAAWTSAGFYSKLAASLSGFNSKFNEIRNETKPATTKGGKDYGW